MANPPPPENRQWEIMTGTLNRLTQAITEMNDRMERLETSNPRNGASTSRNNGPRLEESNDGDSERDVEFISEEEIENEEPQPRGRQSKDNNLNSIKLKIPEFRGESNPDLYLEWEDKVEKIFDIHDYGEQKKVKLAVVEFASYASTWWRKMCKSRADNGTRQIATWAALKKLMRTKFVPVHHKRELFQKL